MSGLGFFIILPSIEVIACLVIVILMIVDFISDKFRMET